MLNEAVLNRRKRRTVLGKLSNAGSAVMDLRGLTKLNALTIIFIQVIVFCALSVMYLMFSNNHITQGYVVNKFEAERNQLIIENEVTNRLIEEARALSGIYDEMQDKMIAHYQPVFVEHTSHVAVAR